MNKAANWNLMTVQILNEVGSGRLGVAAAYSMVLLVIVMVAFGVINRLVGRAAQDASTLRF